MRRTVRIGAVSYLNTKPLIWGLEQDAPAEGIELSLDVPSVLARRMAGGELDLALLPVIELATIGATELVPGLAITTHGAARSVLLVARRPLEELRSVALDGESRTSNALARVLLAERYGSRPRFATGPLDLERALALHDAAVRIGDKALFEPRPDGASVHDLGLAWTEATGLPFVFAVWAARPGVLDPPLVRLLHDSRRRGAAALERIAESFTWNGRRDAALVREYLMDHIHYRLGDGEIEAMRRFFLGAARLGLIERPPAIVLAPDRGTETAEPMARSAAPGSGAP